MSTYLYLFALFFCTVAFVFLESRFSWRKTQRQKRAGLKTDLGYAAFNALLLGPLLVFLICLLLGYPPPFLENFFPVTNEPIVFSVGVENWPLWFQVLVVVVCMDFIQWSIHNLLHRIPRLWEIHKVHHSVVDGEMDWLVSLRFHWGEQIIYTTAQYLPLAYLGFSPYAILAHSLLVIFWGYLNHANLDVGYGRWRYMFNSPKMHLWHHDAIGEKPKNFGVIFSVWDWIFGTAFLPPHPPKKLGFSGVERLPQGFFRQFLWPFVRKTREL